MFDYAVLLVLGLSMLVGVTRGLVKEVLSLLAWIIAFAAANAFGARVAAMLPAAVPGDALRLIVAFIAVLIVTRVLVGLVALVIDALVTATGLSIVNRGLGAIFGFARGIVFVLAAVLVCGMTSVPRLAFWKDALFSPMAEAAVRSVLPFLPAALVQHVHF